MAEIQKTKAKLLNVIHDFAAKPLVQADKQTWGKVQDLLADIQKDYYTVAVVGEFKRGKSTFVNALLGKSLLPMDILTETTTINAVMYAEKPSLTVIKTDGSSVQGEASYDYLSQFSAQNSKFDAASVSYVKIGYPLPILKPRIVLIDTPGVSDINEQRCDITFQVLPKVNAVIFLLDATSPLKKTEKDFIDERILPMGIQNIIFLANKYDNVDDDDEEEDDVLEDLQERLEKAFHIGQADACLNHIEMYPLSGKWALEGQEQNNPELYAASGMPAVQKRLQEILFDGSIEREKVQHYQMRFSLILSRFLRNLESQRSLKLAEAADLERAIHGIDSLLEEREKDKKNIAAYTEKTKDMMYAMTDKSLQHFHKRLQTEIEDAIMSYHGIGFKNFVEQTIYRRIQRNFENWAGIYSPHLDQLLQALERELARGMSYHFKQQIQFVNEAGHEMKAKPVMLHLEAADLSGVNLQAGAIAAIGGIGILTLVGGTIMPLISFAALPYLRDKMLQNRLESAKQEILPQIRAQIAAAMTQLRKETHRYLDENCLRICQRSEYAYEMALQNLRQQVQAELSAQKAADNDVHTDVREIDQELQDTQQMLAVVNKEET